LGSNTQHTDSELFDLISQGDKLAFRQVFDLYKTKLYFFVLHIVNNEAESEELVQDIFLRLWVSRQALSGISKPDSYLFVVAKNRSLDHIQQAAKEREMKNVLTRTMEFGENTTEEDIYLNESKRLIEAAISKLPQQQARVFRLSKEQGLKRFEIAQALNISENTVKNHLGEAIRFIKKYLQEHGDIAFLFFLWYILQTA
jgi:RNA polymerase sigma-70 factor (family 1)